MSGVAVAVGGMALVGGIASTAMQSKAANKATNAQLAAADQQAQVTWDMYNTSRNDMEPFRQMGTNEAANAFGYTPQNVVQYPNNKGLDPSIYGAYGVTPQSQTAVQPGQQQYNPYAGIVPGPAPAEWNASTGKAVQDVIGWYQPPPVTTQGDASAAVQPGQQLYGQNFAPGVNNGVITGTEYVKTGEGIDPTGGAKTYLDTLMKLDPTIATDATGGAGKWADEMAKINPNIDVDPTGGADKYKQQLEALEFKLNPTDEIYKWREAQTNKTIEQAAAARGMYNSRPTINALGDANMALQEQEIGRQYEQNYLSKYKQLADLYNMSMNLGGTNYGKAVDDYNRMYGQQADQFNMATQLGGINYGQATDNYNRMYGQQTDAFNMATKLGQLDYGKALDAIKMGQGAAATMGQNALVTGGQMSDIYGNTGNALAANELYKGQNTAKAINGITNSGLMAYGLYNLNK